MRSDQLQHVPQQIVSRLKEPTTTSRGLESFGRCTVCGALTWFRAGQGIPQSLVEEWKLTPELAAAYNRRESRSCWRCGCTFRIRQVGRALLTLYGTGREKSLAALTRTPAFRSLRILGIDLALLSVLERCPGFVGSDYVTSLVPARGRCHDRLPYADASFDVAILMDILEHVPMYRHALAEIARVLVPGGRLVTTQPAIFSRRTVTRCVMTEDSQLQHLLPPSNHCRGVDDSLVFVEFGIDLIDDFTAAGFETSIYFYNVPADDCSWVAVCEKP